MSKIKKLYLDLCMCSIFRSMLEEPLLLHFADYARAEAKDEKIKAYSAMVAEIYSHGGSLTDEVRRLVYENEKEIASVMEIPLDAILSYQEGMQMVAHYRTLEMSGTGAQIFQHYPIPICAKTGTAETGINGQDNNGAFLCYAPANDPQIAIAVYGEKSGSGSVMGNVAKGILDVFFDVGKAAEVPTYENSIS